MNGRLFRIESLAVVTPLIRIRLTGKKMKAATKAMTSPIETMIASPMVSSLPNSIIASIDSHIGLLGAGFLIAFRDIAWQIAPFLFGI